MRFTLILLVMLAACGCARMKVRKVPLQCRATGADTDIKGFRYYLARPYVIVKAPILVSESVEHVMALNDTNPNRRTFAPVSTD